MNEEKLITLVRQNECLYNQQHRNYDNYLFKENVWRDIADELRCTAEECKTKWAALRAYFRRALGRRKTASGKPAKKINKKWRYEEQMRFLKQHLLERGTQPNISFDEEEAIEESEDTPAASPSVSVSVPFPSPSISWASSSNGTKRKNDSDSYTVAQTLTKFIESRTKPPAKRKLMVFFDDIAETMLKFSDLDQAELKSTIFNLVNKKEVDVLRQRQATNLVPIHNDTIGYDASYPIDRPERTENKLLQDLLPDCARHSNN